MKDSLGGVTTIILASWNDSPLARLSLDFTTKQVDGLESTAKIIEEFPDGLARTSRGQVVLDRILNELPKNPIDLRFESGHVFLNGQLYLPSLTEVLFSR